MEKRDDLIKKWGTVLWLVIAGGILCFSTRPTSANEWGDYLAGVFAPLALLWVVLGYRQQGEELRLQAKELRNSVSQQAAMVEVASSQLDLERTASTARAAAERRLALPDIRTEIHVVRPVDTYARMTISLENLGGSIKDIRYKLPAKVKTKSPPRYLLRGQVKELTLDSLITSVFSIQAFGVSDLGDPVFLKCVVNVLPDAEDAVGPFTVIDQIQWDSDTNASV